MQTLGMNHIMGASIPDQVLEIIAQAPGCQMRYVARLLPDLSLREVFNILRYLSNNGQVNLKVDNQEGVAITVSPQSFN